MDIRSSRLQSRSATPRCCLKSPESLRTVLYPTNVPGRSGAERDDERADMREKRPDLPANFLVAAKTVAQSPRKGAWVDVPMASGTKLHTWISYPQGTMRAPVVLIFQPGPGMDMGEPPTRGGGANWLRAIADQLA